MHAMSRLRRLVVSDRWFFVACRVLPRRRILSESQFACLARVIQERRGEHDFLLSAWVFLPDHWHAIIYPPYPLAISTVMESINGGATKRINRSPREAGGACVAALFVAMYARCPSVCEDRDHESVRTPVRGERCQPPRGFLAS